MTSPRSIHPPFRSRPDHIAVERVPVLGGLDLIEARFAGHPTPMHSHEEVEIGVVSAGRRSIACGHRRYQVPAGSIVVFPPGEFHAGQPLGAAGSTYRSFLVRQETLASACGWTGPETFPSPVVPDPRLASQLFAAHAALRRPGADGERVRSLFTQLGRHRRRPAQRADEDGAVQRVRDYLDRRYTETVRLTAVADLVGLSVFGLIRSFRAAIGLPPYAYLEQVRVHRAVRLLRDGHEPSRVAFLTGFADQSHLTRFFKRLIGVPPGRYQHGAQRRRCAADCQ